MPVKCAQQHGKILSTLWLQQESLSFLFQRWHKGQPECSPRGNDHLQHSLTKMFHDSTPDTEPRGRACIVLLGAHEPFRRAQKPETTAFIQHMQLKMNIFASGPWLLGPYTNAFSILLLLLHVTESSARVIVGLIGHFLVSRF